MEVSYTIWFTLLLVLIIGTSTILFCYVIFFMNRPNRKIDRRTSSLRIYTRDKNARSHRVAAVVRPQVSIVPNSDMEKEHHQLPHGPAFNSYIVQPRREKNVYWAPDDLIEEEIRAEPSAPPLPQ